MVVKHRHDRSCRPMAIGSDQPPGFWRGVIRQLIARGALQTGSGDYATPVPGDGAGAADPAQGESTGYAAAGGGAGADAAQTRPHGRSSSCALGPEAPTAGADRTVRGPAAMARQPRPEGAIRAALRHLPRQRTLREICRRPAGQPGGRLASLARAWAPRNCERYGSGGAENHVVSTARDAPATCRARPACVGTRWTVVVHRRDQPAGARWR